MRCPQSGGASAHAWGYLPGPRAWGSTWTIRHRGEVPRQASCTPKGIAGQPLDAAPPGLRRNTLWSRAGLPPRAAGAYGTIKGAAGNRTTALARFPAAQPRTRTWSASVSPSLERVTALAPRRRPRCSSMTSRGAARIGWAGVGAKQDPPFPGTAQEPESGHELHPVPVPAGERVGTTPALPRVQRKAWGPDLVP